MIFGCMIVNGSLLLLVRSFSAAMLMLAGTKYLVMYMVGDMALYLVLKVARGDFHYWIPIDGMLGVLVSLISRVIAKTIVDFTGIVHFRHPYELGGLFWTANVVLALLASFASVWLYFENDGEAITERAAWTLVGYMSGAWIITFGLFLLLMKEGYRRTFFSTMSGKNNSMNYFLMGADDEAKSAVLDCNKHHYRQIRGEVKAWVREGWWRWEADRPGWFTESWIAKVPPDMVPSEAKQAAKDMRASARRKSSFFLVAKEPLAKEDPRRVLSYS